MDPVQVLAALANLSVIVGIGLGLLQLRAIARQRQEDMVLRAFEPFLDPAFSRAFWEVQAWKYTTFAQFDAEATLEDRVTLDVVSVQFETMGLLYKRGLVELDFLDDLMAEPTLMTWNRIAPIVYGFRAKANVPGWSQWHERPRQASDGARRGPRADRQAAGRQRRRPCGCVAGRSPGIHPRRLNRRSPADRPGSSRWFGTED